MCKKAIRKSFFPVGNIHDYGVVRYGEDLLQTLDIMRRNPKTVFIQDWLYFYRTNSSSLTQSLKLEQYTRDIITVGTVTTQQMLAVHDLCEKDLLAYRGFSIRLFANAVSNIARDRAESKFERALFREMRKSVHYRDFLCGGPYDRSFLGKKRIVWFMFRHRMYAPLLWLFKIFKKRK